jgi:uroporphyrinogen decarboxylase
MPIPSQQDSTPSNHLFLRACNGLPVRHTPIWIMRQAGRVLPPYRALRAKYESIQTLFTTPELAAEITLMPIEMLGVDAAILFTDLVTPLGPLGSPFTYAPGPVFSSPVRTAADIAQLRSVDSEVELNYVTQTIDLVCAELPDHIPLIGYAGSPFTLATWLVEGKSSKDFSAFRAMIHSDAKSAHALMERLTELVIDFLTAQINHGVRAIQLFDTSIGVLSAATFREFVFPYLQQITTALRPFSIPRIYFPLGGAHCLPYCTDLDMDVLSIDWRTDIDAAYELVGPQGAVQGNLDPTILYASEETIARAVAEVLQIVNGRPHVFNLGHGLQPDMPYENVAFLVNQVHEQSAHE